MLDKIIIEVAALVGFAALITLFINVAKWLGWIKDGQAQVYSAGANLVLILVVYGFKLFRPDFSFAALDPIMQEAAAVGTLIFTYILQLFGSQLTHETVRGLPIVGKSYSLEREKFFEENLG